MCAATAQQPAPPVQFDREQALAGWTSLAQRVKSLRYSAVREHWESRNGKASRLVGKDIEEYTWNEAGLALAITSMQLDDNGTEKRRPVYLELYNRQYKATLESATGKDDWRLGEINLLADGDAQLKYISITALPWLLANRVPLAQWLADGSFHVNRAEQSADGSRTSLKVYFRYDRDRRKNKPVPERIDIPDSIDGGYVQFDPENFYRVMNYEYRFRSAKSAYTARGHLDYELVDGLPVVKTLTVDIPDLLHPKTGAMQAREVTTFLAKYNADVSDEEFRLSHYGLPEPNGVIWPSSSRWYLWFIGGGIACLIGGVYFWRRSRGRSVGGIQSSATPPAAESR